MTYEKNLDLAYSSLIELNNKINNKELRNVGSRILQDFKEKLYNVPGGSTRVINQEEVLSHHSYKGGLMIHSLGTANMALNIANTYKSDAVDKDIVIFCSMFHDIGKAKCYDIWNEDNQPHMKRLDYDILLGHVYYGVNIIERYLESCKALSEEYKLQILHVIATHHTSRETGALTSRKMVEAIIVHKADDIDALLTPSIEMLEEIKEGEDKTPKVYMLKDYLYKSKRE